MNRGFTEYCIKDLQKNVSSIYRRLYKGFTEECVEDYRRIYRGFTEECVEDLQALI